MASVLRYGAQPVIGPGGVAIVASVGLIASGTLQSVLTDSGNLYPNGSTVLVPSGTYYEDNLTIPAGRTLTLRAITDGGPVLSAYTSTPITSGWTQVGATPVYQQALAGVRSGVMVSGRPLTQFSNLTNLTNAKYANGTTDAPPEGFYSDGTNLYLRLEGGGSPNGTSVYVTRSGLGTTSTGTGINVGSSNSITFEGWTFEGFPRRAIFVDESGTLIMRRCWFHNCWHGIEDPGTPNVATSHIRMEYCTFNMRGTSGTYNGPFAIRKYLGTLIGKDSQGSSGGTNGVYGSNLGNSALATVTCDDFQGYRCIVHDSWDAFQVKGRNSRVAGGTDYGWANRTSYLRENLFWRCSDNAQENDTADKFQNIEVDHNIAVDCFQPMSMAPFMAGRVDVHHNVVYISEDWYTDVVAPSDGKPTLSKWFKHSSSGTAIGAAQSGVNIGDQAARQGACHIYNNTYIGGRSSTQRGKLYDSDETDWTFDDCYYRDNIAIFTDSSTWELGGYVLDSHNLLWHGGAFTSQFNLNHYKHASAGGTTSIWAGATAAYDTRPTTAPLSVNPQLGSTSTTRFNLQSGSPCIGVASDGGDLGAVPFGSAWSMPQVGCQWAAALATRPTVPASIDVTMMGLQ